MLREEEQVVWDETVQAVTAIGTFEVLSTDTTPPPPRAERLLPLSLAEWKLYFDFYIPVPSNPLQTNSKSLGASMIHISYDETKEYSKGTGKIVAPMTEVRRRIFSGVIKDYSLFLWFYETC
jgi:hypothetical protein